ncbi:MAG: GNAT family N-acetyltransferase [Candidatus Faecivivens sp.]|nr:GNAT family N-acetyltransferase [Candidatus Faecivivens sp.]
MNNVFSITDSCEKMRIAREILEALPEWFGLPEARENYIKNSADQPFFTFRAESGEELGFLTLAPTGKDTVELAVMGVKKEHHREGIGRALFLAAKTAAREAGFSFLQVKTVRMGVYPEYDATNRFYLALGFKEFEMMPELWGEENPCQIYVMSLHEHLEEKEVSR